MHLPFESEAAGIMTSRMFIGPSVARPSLAFVRPLVRASPCAHRGYRSGHRTGDHADPRRSTVHPDGTGSCGLLWCVDEIVYLHHAMSSRSWRSAR